MMFAFGYVLLQFYIRLLCNVELQGKKKPKLAARLSDVYEPPSLILSRQAEQS